MKILSSLQRAGSIDFSKEEAFHSRTSLKAEEIGNQNELFPTLLMCAELRC